MYRLKEGTKYKEFEENVRERTIEVNYLNE